MFSNQIVDKQLGPSALEAFRGTQLSVEETTCCRELAEKSFSYLKTPTKPESDCAYVCILQFILTF